MVQNCRNCGAPLAPEDKFCSACGTEVDASLDLPDESEVLARQPSRSRAVIVFFILAAISTLIADLIELQLALRASWDIQSRAALYLVYASLATGVFVILCVLWGRLLRADRSTYFGRGLAVRVVCLILGMSVLFYRPVIAALYVWTDPKGPIWYQFDLLAAALATLFFAVYLALAGRHGA